MATGSQQQQEFHRAMAIKHGDKLFVAIAVLICVEISTFSKMYQNIVPPLYNQDNNNTRRTSVDPTTTSTSDDHNSSDSNINWNNGNSYIRFSNNEGAEHPASASAEDTPSPWEYLVKPRVVFLLDEDNDQGVAISIRPEKHRTVEALGDLGCCSKDPLRYIKPEEKPFYEECTPMAEWQTRYYPTCNMLHELPIIDSDNHDHARSQNSKMTTIDAEVEAKVTLINTQGSWRSVWKVVTQLPFQQHHDNAEHIDDGPQEIVLKTLRYDREFDEESFQLQYVDSMAMERLTSSPYIANEYGFCGQSVLTEFAPKSGRDLIKNKRLQTWQRLQIAHDLAAALSDMHSIDHAHGTNATLTHNDINIANTIQGDNGRIKFNDFNIGVLLRWNKTKPCGSPVRFLAPLWRSPEEIIVDDGTNSTTVKYVQPEKSDTYALGNLLFQVLTTHQPWTWLEPGGRLEVGEVIRKKLAGELPYIPSKFHGGNKTGTQAMYYSTLACYAHDPDDRPTSYQLAEALRISLDWTKQGLPKSKEEVKRLFDFRQEKTDVNISSTGTGGRPQSRRAAATTATNIRAHGTTNASSLVQHHYAFNKTKELLRHKHKQIRDADVAKRTIGRRQVQRPKIGIHYFSPPVKRGGRDIVVVGDTDELSDTTTNRTMEESTF